MSQTNKDIAKEFFEGLSAGQLPEALLAPGLTAWTTTKGGFPGEAYRGGVQMLGSLFPDGLRYTIDSLTADEDRVAAEVHADGILSNGEKFSNVYVFILRIRDGKIESVAEHFNPQPVIEQIIPLLQAAMAKHD